MSSDKNFLIRKVAVLGAGVMGAQIAAHLVNAGVGALLFELPATDGDPNANALKAIDNLKKLDPSPLSVPARADDIQPANYDRHLDLLAECDLVIEAIAERMDWKSHLYRKVAPHLGPATIFASNTSGIPINKLAQALPEALRHRFCGIHFFNPPRYMHLVELIPCQATEPAILDRLEAFLVTTLGKGVIRAKDTPSFIANRVGGFALRAAMYHAEKFGLGFDVVDVLTGPAIGRGKSATFRTADLVGLDTLANVTRTLTETLQSDPWYPYFKVADWLQRLIDQGALGSKTKRGIYRKVDKEIQVLDLKTGEYRPSAGAADPEVAAIFAIKDPAQRFTRLRESPHPQAQYLWSIFRDHFHYCAYHLQDIAGNARDVDLALRWGYGWTQGPFEIWQTAGWERVAGWIAQDIAAGKAMAAAPLPAWVTEAGRTGVHREQGSYAPADGAYKPRSRLPVYRRQPFPDAILGEPVKYGETVFETDAVRLWLTSDDIAVLSFKTKMHTIGIGVLDGVMQAIDAAERNYRALVLWQTEPPFSVGANLSSKDGGRSGAPPSAAGRMLKQWKRAAASLAMKAAHKLDVADALQAGRLAEVEAMVEQFQATTQALKYSMVPTIAAVDGLALGGGCEFILHCDAAAATLESYIGLVETGVGLVPAGGGCKELALRAAADAKGGNLFPFLQGYFQNVARAQVAKSAEHARELGYLRPADRVVMNRFELLHVAKAQARALADAGYRPPFRARDIPVAGNTAIATFMGALTNMREGGFISEHDSLVAGLLARVLCGGDLEPGSLVDEAWFLELERAAFMELLATEKTQARVEHTLKTGKPLRN